MSCCESCAADPVLSVQGCAPCAAAAVAGGGGDPGLAFRNTEMVGDVGEDILRGIATADRFIGDALNPLLRSNPYTSLIADVHDARMSALAEAAPEYYGPGAPGGPPVVMPKPAAPPAPPSPAGPRLALSPGLLARLRLNPGVQAAARAAMRGETIAQTLARLGGIVARAKAGEEGARSILRALRDRSKAGDPVARREWAACLELA